MTPEYYAVLLQRIQDLEAVRDRLSHAVIKLEDSWMAQAAEISKLKTAASVVVDAWDSDGEITPACEALRKLICQHERLASDICDQTLGVFCMDCRSLLAACWQEEHVPESLWNRAAATDDDTNPCEQNRDDYCAVCEHHID